MVRRNAFNAVRAFCHLFPEHLHAINDNVRWVNAKRSAQLLRKVAGDHDVCAIWNAQARETLISELEENRLSIVSASQITGAAIEEPALTKPIKPDESFNGDKVAVETRLLPKEFIGSVTTEGGRQTANQEERERNGSVTYHFA